MTPRHGPLVIDSSAVVALVADRGALGEWTSSAAAGYRLAAPWLMPFEAGNALRRIEMGRIEMGRAEMGRADLDRTAAQLGHDQLRALGIALWAHSRLAERAWALRGTVTYYDASYVALAELLDAPLLTLDRRLARAPGPACVFLTPPEAG